MADRIPVKAIYSGTYGSSDVTSLGELSSGETINGSYITDNSVTLAKMAHGTDGELITYDATGAPANVAVGTSGQVLTSGGVGVAPTFQTVDADTAKTDTAQEWTSQQNFNATTLTFDATQDWDLTTNQVCKLTLTANTTFDAPTNQVDGSVYVITIIQDGTGSRTAGWNTVFKWAGGTAPTLTTHASAKDVFTFVSDGTNMNNVAQVLDVS